MGKYMPFSVSKSIFLTALLLVVFAYSNVVSSSERPITVVHTPQYFINSEPTDISAKAYAVFDVETGEVLAAKDSEKVLPIASVTKLVTAATALKEQDLEKSGEIQWSDVNTEGRAGKLKAGEKYTYRELLFPLLLESSNDAAAFFERETAVEMITAMNDLSENIGMEDTVFADASGLSSRNVSTATDLMKLLRYLKNDESYVLDITSLEQYVGPYTGWVNNSPVLNNEYRGGKHGYTEAAKRTLVALFEEDFAASKREIGYILLGSDDLAMDTATLRDFVENSVRFE